jgi:hypothetical protein
MASRRGWVKDQKVAKSRLNLHGTILEGKGIGSDHKQKSSNERAHDLENQDAS